MSSSSNTYPLVIYYNGRQFDGPNGVRFEGKTKTMKIKVGTTFNELKERIHQKLGVQGSQCIHRMIARLETLLDEDTIFYIGNDITDDEDVEFVIDAFVGSRLLKFIEIYVDVEVGHSSSAPMDTSTPQCFGQEDTVVELSAPAQVLSQITLDEGEMNEEEDEEEDEEENMASEDEGEPESNIPPTPSNASNTDVEGNFDADTNAISLGSPACHH